MSRLGQAIRSPVPRTTATSCGENCALLSCISILSLDYRKAFALSCSQHSSRNKVSLLIYPTSFSIQLVFSTHAPQLSRELAVASTHNTRAARCPPQPKFLSVTLHTPMVGILSMANYDLNNYLRQMESFRAADHARENLVNVSIADRAFVCDQS